MGELIDSRLWQEGKLGKEDWKYWGKGLGYMQYVCIPFYRKKKIFVSQNTEDSLIETSVVLEFPGRIITRVHMVQYC